MTCPRKLSWSGGMRIGNAGVEYTFSAKVLDTGALEMTATCSEIRDMVCSSVGTRGDKWLIESLDG